MSLARLYCRLNGDRGGIGGLPKDTVAAYYTESAVELLSISQSGCVSYDLFELIRMYNGLDGLLSLPLSA